MHDPVKALACWCGGTTFRHGITGTFSAPGDRAVPFAVSFCTACGTGQTVPRPADVDYHVTPVADNDRVRQLPLWERFAAESLAVVRRYCPAGDLLDVGCNIGVLVRQAQAAGYAASGIDTDAAAVAFGRERVSSALQVQELAALPASVYDVVTCEQTLEHVADPLTFLAQLQRVLRPGGFAVVSVPHCRGLVPRLLGPAWYGWWPHEHIWHFTVPAFRRLARRGDWQVAGVQHARLHHEGAWCWRRRGLATAADRLAGIVPPLGDKLFVVLRKENA